MFPTIPGKCACGCGRKLTGKKTRWLNNKHFQRCYDQYALAQGESATVRALVFNRDKGICSYCGIDCQKEKRYWQDTTQLWTWLAEAENNALIYREVEKAGAPCFFYQTGNHDAYITRMLHARWQVQQELLRASGKKNWDGHSWEAHHVKAVAEGGAGCGLDGYKTACVVRCHKRLTRMLVKRLAARKRALQPELAFA